MTRATLADVLQPALREGYAVAGLVCLGWEDMRAYVTAAEAENTPVILQAGPGARTNTPIQVLGTMMGYLADHASVPVVIHLDHGYTHAECKEAIACGFTSIMIDGSRLPLEENITLTRHAATLAHNAGISCEGEIGFVGYAGGINSTGTIPEEAARFAHETQIDAMAVSVGNTHLQSETGGGLDITRIEAIEAQTTIPLVIHGGSGVPHAQRAQLAHHSAICKFNIGTELRMAFGQALRQSVNTPPERFDRIEIMRDIHDPLVTATRHVLSNIKKK